MDSGRAAFPPLKEAALWITVASATVYLAGSLYLGGYYAKFGMPETELDFSVPYTMSSSLLPLLLPAFWLAMVAAACRAFSTRMVRPENASPFFPIPASKAIAYTFSLVALNTLITVVAGPRGPIYAGWTLRGIIFTAVGIAAFGTVFYQSWKAHQANRPPPLKGGATWWVLVLAVGMGLLSMVIGDRKWPYSLGQNIFLAIAVLFTAGTTLWEMRKARHAPATTGEWKEPQLSRNRSLVHPAVNIFLVVLAVMALLLQSGLSGNASAAKIVDGCDGIKTVRFDPVPTGLRNESYLLVLHQNDRYYVIPQANSTGLQIVSERNDLTATLGWRAASGHCQNGL